MLQSLGRVCCSLFLLAGGLYAQWPTTPDSGYQVYVSGCSTCMSTVASLADEAKGTYVFLRTSIPNNHQDGLYVQRYTHEATPVWSTKIVDGTDSQEWGDMSIGPHGALYVGFQSMQQFAYQGIPLYWRHARVQKLDTLGIPHWEDGGVFLYPTATDTATQFVHTVIPDVAGGVFVLWEENGTLSGYEKTGQSAVAYDTLGQWVQHISATGMKQWEGRGRIFQQVDSLNGFNTFAMYPDGNGGFIGWEMVHLTEDSSAFRLNHYRASVDTLEFQYITEFNFSSLMFRDVVVGNHIIFFYKNDGTPWKMQGYTPTGTRLYEHPIILDGVTDVYEVKADNEGNIFLCGESDSTNVIWKITLAGTIIWTRTVENAEGFVPDNLGGIVYVRFEASGDHGSNYDEGFISRINAAGEPQWTGIQFANHDRFWYPYPPSFTTSPDGFGGAYLFWIGQRIGDNFAVEFPAYRALMNHQGQLGVPMDVQPGRPNLPTTFQVWPAYPNPFNAATTIALQVPATTTISVTIFDIMGRVVRTVEQNRTYHPGTYQLQWDGTNQAGLSVGSGVYFCRLTTPATQQVQKVMLVK